MQQSVICATLGTCCSALQCECVARVGDAITACVRVAQRTILLSGRQSKELKKYSKSPASRGAKNLKCKAPGQRRPV